MLKKPTADRVFTGTGEKRYSPLNKGADIIFSPVNTGLFPSKYFSGQAFWRDTA
jgi:hypothetical protein